MKATSELIKSVLAKKVWECSKEELNAILPLVGLRAKEFTSAKESVSFELHHATHFALSVQSDSSCRVCTFDNAYHMEMGLSTPIENIKDLISTTVGVFIPRLPFVFEGPTYNERIDEEYSSAEELNELLDILKAELAD